MLRDDPSAGGPVAEAATAAPEAPARRGPIIDVNFEAELNANLSALFGGRTSAQGLVI